MITIMMIITSSARKGRIGATAGSIVFIAAAMVVCAARREADEAPAQYRRSCHHAVIA